MNISLQQASQVISAAEARASEMGVPVIVTVLDAGCHVTAIHRMDGAPLGSIDVSMGKAKTAALFSCNSEDVWEFCKPGAPAHGLENSNGGLMPFGGGVPLRAPDGSLIGAVGISGGAVPQDSEIAQAAASAL